MIFFWMICAFISGFVYCFIGYTSLNYFYPTVQWIALSMIFFWPYWFAREAYDIVKRRFSRT